MSAYSKEVQKVVEELTAVLDAHKCSTTMAVHALSLCILAGTAMATDSEAEFLTVMERIAEGLLQPTQVPDFWAYTQRTFKQPTAH
jgi:uncharacterized protein YejL (UPF0352 family)